MIENVIGRYSLPFAQWRRISSSIRATVLDSHGHRGAFGGCRMQLCRQAIQSERRISRQAVTNPIMIGQLQVLDMPDFENCGNARKNLAQQSRKSLASVNESLAAAWQRAAAARSISKSASLPGILAIGDMLVVHLLYDTRDAMGANAINTALEAIAPLIERISGGRVNLRILSNLSDRRLARASGSIKADQIWLTGDSASGESRSLTPLWKPRFSLRLIPIARRRITKAS